ncbi:MAG: phosphatase PAP2 family protein [Acidimicrobiia bacterium]
MRLRAALLVAYGAAFVWSFEANGLPVARMAVLAWVGGAFIVGNVGKPFAKQRQMVLDLVFYATMWLSYDYSRGIADTFGFPLQVEAPRNIDRALFLGADPNEWMQRHFLESSVRWYDVVGSLVYFTHFFVPVATSVYLWIRYRDQWVRYVRRFATVLFAGVLTYVVLPTAPPWMASSTKYPYRIMEPLARTTGRGWNELGLETVNSVLLRGQQWANPTAALPSLHAAFALFVVVFFWDRLPNRLWRGASLSFPLAMALSLVYFGEHWVIDVIAGWLYVGASFWFWDRWERRRAVNDVLTPSSTDHGVA